MSIIQRWIEQDLRHPSSQKKVRLLFGARQTGKTTLLRSVIETEAHKIEFDLQDASLRLAFERNPGSFSEQLLAAAPHPRVVFVDEIQKAPMLLDEIHWLIENHKIQFILTGSSARKLKRASANMLGGRALLRHLFPFLYLELENDFDLEKVLKLGSLPGMYFDSPETATEKLTSYVETYLKEEIMLEAAVRNIGHFHRFLEVAAQHATELLNFENIAREASIKSGVIKSYLQILDDTLIGYILPPWDQSVRKQLGKHPKFYFFDNGVLNSINRQSANAQIHPELRGKLFEQWIINEVRAVLSYLRSSFKMYFWQTKAGNEVDLLLARNNLPEIAIEIKAKRSIGPKDMSGLKSLGEEYPQVKQLLVCEEVFPRSEGEIQILPYKTFLSELGPFLNLAKLSS